MKDPSFNKSYIAQGLAGVSTPEAMEMRRDLMKDSSVDKSYIAQGLAGVSTPEAMEMRRDFMKNFSVDKSYIAYGLAGVSTPEAMEMRRDFMKDSSVDKSYIAQGLAGVSTPEAMEMRERLSLDYDISLPHTYTTNSLFVDVVVERVQNSQEIKRNEIFPAEYVDSVLKRMKELMKDPSANKNDIAQGLAGVSAPEAMEMRRDLMKDSSVDKSYIAQGLAGVSTPEAMEMRRDLMKDFSVSKSYIAQGLAGVSTPESMEMRRDFMKDPSINKSHIAQGLAGVSTPEAMEMRRDLMKDSSVPKLYIAYGLAGVSTPESMEMRRDLMKDPSINKSYIAQGLAGVSTPEAMEMRRELGEKYELQYSFCNSSSLIMMTRIYENINKDFEGLTEMEKEKIEQLTLIINPDKVKESDFLQKHELDVARRLSVSHNFASKMNKVISKNPALFFDDIRAKGKKFKTWEVTNIVHRLFPRIKIENERKKQASKFFSNGPSFDNSSDNFFANKDYFDLLGGDPSMESVKGGLMIEFRDSVKGMLCSNIALQGNRETSAWQKIEFSVSKELAGPTEEITGEIPNLKSKEIILPRFDDAKVIPERIKVLDKNDNELTFSSEIDQLGQCVVKSETEFSKVLYSQEKQIVPSVPDDVSDVNYKKFRLGFEKRYGRKGTDKILDLPAELKIFIASIKGLSPVNQLIEIEEMVRAVSFYDMNNKESMEGKYGKGNDEKLFIMRSRMEELNERGVASSGKMFAGVCADFAMLTTAMLREAGFVSGIISGLKINGKSADAKNAHALSFVVWPKGGEKSDFYTLDGTPDGEGVYDGSFVDLVREKSLRERIEESNEKAELVAEDAEKQLEEIERILEENDLEKIKSLTNGQLEKVLNNLLRYKVKRKHLYIIETILGASKYGGVNMDDTESAGRFIEFVIQGQRKTESESIGNDGAGKEFFEAIQEYIRRYKAGGDSTEGALKKIERALKLSESYLSTIEAKAAFATLNYLKAKNLI